MSGRIRRSGRSGGTLLEAAVAIVLVAVALGGFARAISSSLVTSDQHAQSTRALEAARRTIETLQGTPFDEVYARYNADPTDDPANAPGPGFAVDGLEPLANDADGLVGEVVFPTAGAGANLELREDLDLFVLGMPRDLNGDGAIDALDHADDHVVLPVLVRVRWRGPTGASRVELKTLLAEM